MGKYNKYQELKNNPATLQIKSGAKEVIFKTISVMCDNVSYLKFKKEGGEFRLSGMGNSISNWQMDSPAYELEWLADEQGWDEVIEIIHTGTSRIESVRSR